MIILFMTSSMWQIVSLTSRFSHCLWLLKTEYSTSQGGCLWLHLTWLSLSFSVICIFPQILEVCSHYFSNILSTFSLFFLDSSMSMLVHLVSDFLDEHWTFEYNDVIILEITFFPLPGVCWGFFFFFYSCFYLLLSSSHCCSMPMCWGPACGINLRSSQFVSEPLPGHA